MTYTNYTSQAEANISINKNKVKSYGGNFYLHDGQEFQIELFNPTRTTKLAQISMNGKLISTKGIVLKPGQRVHLDRFIDTPKKFKFETYIVDVANSEVRNAIVSNGDISVSFFDEQESLKETFDGYHATNYKSKIFNELQSPLYRSNTTTLDSMNCFNSQTVAASSQNLSASFSKTLERETGRVEQGSNSDQDFLQYSGKFNSWASNTVYMKILPVSEKPLEVKDLAIYCTECGTRNKGGVYKFCPTCGTKY